MTLPTADTRVTYPAGSIDQDATVVHVEALPDHRIVVLLDATSSHPVDASWPDQGADHAVLRVADTGAEFPVLDCVVAATDGQTLYIGEDVPVRKGEEGWTFVVAHVLAADAVLAEGDAVSVLVDEPYRRALSIGHTACHVASLALNEALASRWSKAARADGLGNPDFDGLAIESSRIRENGSTDRFRLNKSLRRKGFATDCLADELGTVQAGVNATLADWMRADSAVRIDREGDALTDRRLWVCELGGTQVRIPCGGTHASALTDLGSIVVELSMADAEGTPVLVMHTTTSPAGS